MSNQKRKFTVDDTSDEGSTHTVRPTFKQLKLGHLAQRRSAEDEDMAMTDASYIPFPSLSQRSPSSSSIHTASSSLPSPNYTLSSLQYPTTPASSYPNFELYPGVETGMDIDAGTDTTPRHAHSASTDSQLGLLQPSSGTTVFQHGGNCTQIPRLRLSSHAGLHGTRSLWSHCESCGAIDMVKA